RSAVSLGRRQTTRHIERFQGRLRALPRSRLSAHGMSFFDLREKLPNRLPRDVAISEQYRWSAAVREPMGARRGILPSPPRLAESDKSCTLRSAACWLARLGSAVKPTCS